MLAGGRCTAEMRNILEAACTRIKQETEKEVKQAAMREIIMLIRQEIAKLPDDKDKEKQTQFWQPVLTRLHNRYGVRV